VTPADTLAAKIAPALVAALSAQQESIIAASGGPFARWWCRFLFPTFLQFVPSLANVSVNVIALEFGGMTINDFIAIFAERAKELQRTK
jgi:hypothetical protein